MSNNSLIKKRLLNTSGLTESTKADELYQAYINFKREHERLADAITANFRAETEGTSRNSTTVGIIETAQTLALVSDNLAKAIGDYVRYLEKTGGVPSDQLELLKSYRSKFTSYSIKLRFLITKAKEFQRTKKANTYSHHKRVKTGAFDNYRGDAVALKIRSSDETTEMSIVLNQFTSLLRQVLPPRYSARITPTENVEGVGNLFGEGGKRSNRRKRTFKRTVSYKRRHTHRNTYRRVH